MPEHGARIAGVAWDLDGTLIDSAEGIGIALNRLLAEQGLPRLGPDAVRLLIGEGVHSLVRRALLPHGPAPDARVETLVERFLHIYSGLADRHSTLYPGAREALAGLHAGGIRQAICTNKPETVTQRILAGLDVAEYFGTIVGGRPSRPCKPDPAPLIEAIDGLGVPVDRVLLVGDSAIDVATARAAGVSVAVVTHGYADAAPESLGADFVLADFATLTKMLLPAGGSRAAPG